MLPVHFVCYISHSGSLKVGQVAEDIMGGEEAEAMKGKQQGQAGMASKKSFDAGCETGWEGRRRGLQGASSPAHDNSVLACCSCPCWRKEVKPTLHRCFMLMFLMPWVLWKFRGLNKR